MALDRQQISDIIYDAWTNDPNSGFADEFDTNTDMQKMVRAQCDAIAEAIVEGVTEGVSGGATQGVWQDPPDVFLSPIAAGTVLALSHVPLGGSLVVVVNGQVLEAGVDYSVSSGLLTLASALAGNDRLLARYQYGVT